ncbi:hypothetical protein [Plebeiibacterium sediminum]|uniref:Uncharacterized protein n=1 Tax=Plebeiibacterium sediminum TaxID=2992112 RepID=A0AAE3SG12_9BACT|nr:hypothetical protein [Plebeiobacterium sediminum]MCW3787993.1 hypothetical protein [Plebeiobacterium sediminum]
MTSYQFDESNIQPYFKGLSHTQLVEIVSHFHNKDLTLSKIIENYNLGQATFAQFLKLLPPLLLSDKSCAECVVLPLIRHIKRGKLSGAFCPSCEKVVLSDVEVHKKFFPESSHKNKKSKTKQLSSIKIISISKAKYESLDIDVKLFLHYLIDKGISKDYTVINGKNLSTDVLVPNVRYQEYLMTTLGAEGYYPHEVNINIDPEIAHWYFKSGTLFPFHLDEKFVLWRKIAVQEVVEIFFGTLESKGLITDQGAAVVPIMEDLIRIYSVGQLINLVWQSFNSWYNKYLKKSSDKMHIANMIIYTCQNRGEYKKQRCQKVLCYDRPETYPQSELSKYLFNDVLKIGDKGFTKIPCPSELYSNPNIVVQSRTITFN